MILVLAEHLRGEIRPITFEILTKAAEMAGESNTKVSTVLLADGSEEFVEELKPWTDEILVAEDRKYKDFNSDVCKEILAGVIKENKPDLILMGQTSQGMELAPPLATKLGIPLVTGAIEVRWNGGKPLVERDVFGGKARSEVKFTDGERYMLTIRPASFKAEKPTGLNADIVKLEPSIPDAEVRREVLGLFEPEAGEVDITSSDILVAVGRGIGDEMENLQIAEELAEALGGETSCTRPIVDKGWLPESRLIGQSGKTVEPKFLIAIGISGEFYFTVGMENSDTIIAINTDADAPIFGIADYGIVDDLFEVVPKLTELLRGK